MHCICIDNYLINKVLLSRISKSLAENSNREAVWKALGLREIFFFLSCWMSELQVFEMSFLSYLFTMLVLFSNSDVVPSAPYMAESLSKPSGGFQVFSSYQWILSSTDFLYEEVV